MCKHFTGLGGNATCAAGVEYETVALDGEWKYGYAKDQTTYTSKRCYPCNGKMNFGGATCPSLALLTAEEVEAEDREQEASMQRTFKALKAIQDETKGQRGVAGKMPCPNCGESLGYSVASCNGHIWAKCKTDGCVAFMQ